MNDIIRDVKRLSESKFNSQDLRKLNEKAKEYGVRYELRELDQSEGDEKNMRVYFERYDHAFNHLNINEMEMIIREFERVFPNVDFYSMHCRSLKRRFKIPELIKLNI